MKHHLKRDKISPSLEFFAFFAVSILISGCGTKLPKSQLPPFQSVLFTVQLKMPASEGNASLTSEPARFPREKGVRHACVALLFSSPVFRAANSDVSCTALLSGAAGEESFQTIVFQNPGNTDDAALLALGE